MTVTMSGQEVTIAKKRFEEHWSCPVGCESWDRFIGNLYHDFDIESSRFVWKMSEAQAHTIRLLNGPHYKTILKMMAVQWTEGVEHG